MGRDFLSAKPAINRPPVVERHIIHAKLGHGTLIVHEIDGCSGRRCIRGRWPIPESAQGCSRRTGQPIRNGYSVVSPTSVPRCAGCESLDHITKDHAAHCDRRADSHGQNKVQTADNRHGFSLGNESTLHVWNTHECNNCTVTFVTGPVQLHSGQASKHDLSSIETIPTGWTPQ